MRRLARKPAESAPQSVRQYVAKLARRHNIVYSPTLGDQWAECVTRLAGDEVKADRTRDLLVALARAKVINQRTMITLIASHIRETEASRRRPSQEKACV